jgi:glycosyltransferase involved in cell wall biosynthesis
MVFVTYLKSTFISILTRLVRLNFLFMLKFYLLFNVRKKQDIERNKISIINTFDQGGGAAKIAFDLTESLQNDFSIKLYVKKKQLSKSWVIQIPEKKHGIFAELLKREASAKGWVEFAGFQSLTLFYDSFYLKSSIVHIHNLHGEFLSPMLFPILFKQKKVIWTLHDESIITGHCACTLSCEKWKNGCGNCPNLLIYPPVNYDNTKKVLASKKQQILDLQPIIICPSYWLADRVKIQFPELTRIEVIPNGVNTDVFCLLSKSEARKKLNLPTSGNFILFVAEFATNNPFKGGEILRDIIADSQFKKFTFITVGGHEKTEIPNHISYPYITDEVELALLYVAADVLIYPTQADNLPLVVLESMACGTPVIASKLGGIPEIISSNQFGFLVDNYQSSFGFKQALLRFFELPTLEREKMGAVVSSHINNHFSLRQMKSNYSTLYRTL